MATPRRIRLSPSGPFVPDAVTGAGLQSGDGSTGLIWRQQGPVGTWTAIPGGPVPGLSMAWTLEPGYRYDLVGKVLIKSNDTEDAVGALTVDVEIEEASAPGVWASAIHGGAVAFNLVIIGDEEEQDDCRILRVTNTHLNRSAAAVNVTGVRLTLSEAMVDGTLSYLPQQCSVTAQQYVLGT